MKSSQNTEYLNRINIVCDYIEKNLCNAFTLDELSSVSGFSKYHFHRIFSGYMNETLYNYITRLKLERAVGELIMLPQKDVTDIALDYGFADSAAFARAFKKLYSMSATQYRKAFSKISKEGKIQTGYNQSIKTKKRRFDYMDVKCNVEVKTIEPMTTAYLRHIGTYEELGRQFKGMIGRLMGWAGAKGLLDEKTKLLAIYHDNPNITEEDKLKTSICVTVPEGTKVDEEIGSLEIAGGEYAIAHFEIDDKDAAAQHSMSLRITPYSKYTQMIRHSTRKEST